MTQLIKFDYSIITSCYKLEKSKLIEYVFYLKDILETNQSFYGEAILIIENEEKYYREIILKKTEHLNYPLRILISQKKGFASCLNLGVNEAKGNYIVRLDPDDTFKNMKIDYQLREMIKKNADISYSNILVENKEIKYPKNKFEILISLGLGFNPIPHTTVIFKKNLFHQTNLYDEKNIYAEDFDLWIRSLIYSKKFLHIPNPLTTYSIQNTSRKARSNARAQIIIRFKYLKLLLKLFLPILSGLLINIIRFVIPLHHNSLHYLKFRNKSE